MGHVLMAYPSDDNVAIGRVGDLQTITATEKKGRSRHNKICAR